MTSKQQALSTSAGKENNVYYWHTTFNEKKPAREKPKTTMMMATGMMLAFWCQYVLLCKVLVSMTPKRYQAINYTSSFLCTIIVWVAIHYSCNLLMMVLVHVLDILFSSNHNIHKSSCGLYFWAWDPLIEYKSLKPINKGHTNIYECCDLRKKYI